MSFKEWAHGQNVTETAPFTQLDGKTIAIEARDYVNNILTNQVTREPLLPALGGLPFALEEQIKNQLSIFQKHNISPIFVFDGLDTVAQDRATLARRCKAAAQSLDDAWALYNASKAEEAVAEFGKSCTFRTSQVDRWLQSYLHKEGISKGVQIQIAPYSASAQVAYLESSGFVDAVAGSPALLVYNVDQVITHLDFDRSTFSWLSRRKCLDALGQLSPDQFVDACLLSGSTLLPPCPQIEHDVSLLPKIRLAANLVRSRGDGNTICQLAKDDDYLALYRKARTAVRHPVVLTADGHVEPQNTQAAPGDLVEVIGSRLPDETYFYLSRGVIGPRILQWRTSLEIYEMPPLDGGVNPAYEELVQKKLTPLRAQALSLLSCSLTRYYLKKDVELVCWFDENTKRPLGIPEMADSREDYAGWHVKNDLLESVPKNKDVNMENSSIAFAVQSLADESFAKKTVTPRKKESGGGFLSTNEELFTNTMWRFLQSRGYVKTDHTLSEWGRALHSAFSQAHKDHLFQLHISTNIETEEAIFLAFELLRLNVLSGSNMFPANPYTGGPMRGTSTDRANTLLISRIACLARFQHSAIGYTGPLSRHLLAFHSMCTAVRSTMRDLVEIQACSLLLSGAVSRDLQPSEYSDLGYNLPFIKEPDLALSLAVKTYLDELSQDKAKRADIKNYFPHAIDFDGDLNKAWKLWGAVNSGVQAASDSIINAETKATFSDCNAWLQNALKEGSTQSANA